MKYHMVRNQRPIKYKEFIQQIQNSSRSSLNEPSILSQRSHRDSGGNNKSSKTVQNKNIFIDDNSSPQQIKVKDYGEQVKEKEFKITRKLVQQQSQQQYQQCSSDINSNSTRLLLQNNGNNADKLYTFCDAKLTQRSVQTSNKQNQSHNHQHIIHRNQLLQHGKSNINIGNNNNKHLLKLQESCPMQKAHSEQKYFRTNKQKSQQKENINFVNSVLAKVESMNQNRNKQSENTGRIGQHEEGSFLKVKESYQSTLNGFGSQPLQMNSVCSSQQNTQRKIQSVRKVRVKQSITQTSHKPNNTTNSQSNQKLREQSLTQIKGKQPQQSQQIGHKQVLQSREKERNPSSKKKIVALNINSKKGNSIIQNNNKIKLKLTMQSNTDKERICDQSGSQNKPKFRQQQNNIIIEGRNLYGSLVSENTRMKSLQQSKIQITNNDQSNHNLLMSGSSLTDLAHFLTKQSNNLNTVLQPQIDQIQRLHTVINNHIYRQNQLSKQISYLHQQLKNTNKCDNDNNRQIQIIQKDCYRLTTSYKQIKRLYQLEVTSKQQIQTKNNCLLMEIVSLKQQLRSARVDISTLRQQNTTLLQTTRQLRSQNTDLKQCLKYKQSIIDQLEVKIIKITKCNQQMQQQMNNRQQLFPPELEGLSEMIKEKITQYEESIQNYIRQVEEMREENILLQDQNQNLMVIRHKLQNFTALLKQQIDDKDALIDDYQSQLRQLSQLRKSIKSDNHQNQFTQTKLKLKIKQLQSKLKLANSHIEYLTKEIIDIKHQKYQVKEDNSRGNHNRIDNKYQTVKSTNITTVGNSLTTRYSSITHFDTLNSCYPYHDLEALTGNGKIQPKERDREQQFMEIQTEHN